MEDTTEEKEVDKVAMSGVVKGKKVVMTSIYYWGDRRRTRIRKRDRRSGNLEGTEY